jgi:hypothetical protein
MPIDSTSVTEFSDPARSAQSPELNAGLGESDGDAVAGPSEPEAIETALASEMLPTEERSQPSTVMPEAGEVHQSDAFLSTVKPSPSTELPSASQQLVGDPPEIEESSPMERTAETKQQPEPSSAGEVVRQVMDWMGEEGSKEETVLASEPRENVIASPLKHETAMRGSEPNAVEPSIVETQQSLHLSIGSIVMTLEGTPGEARSQSEPQPEYRPAPATSAAPPLRLSRHYLRIR